jgi:hypothetical protein
MLSVAWFWMFVIWSLLVEGIPPIVCDGVDPTKLKGLVVYFIFSGVQIVIKLKNIIKYLTSER